MRRIVGTRFQGEDFGPQKISGLAEPVVVHSFSHLSHRDATGRHRLVGREVELGEISSTLNNCKSNTTGCLIQLPGEPGIGKSYLLEESEKRALEEGFEVHRALILDFGTGSGETAIHQLARNLLGVSFESDDSALTLAVEKATTNGWVEEGNRAHLYNLMNLEQPPIIWGNVIWH